MEVVKVVVSLHPLWEGREEDEWVEEGLLERKKFFDRLERQESTDSDGDHYQSEF